MVTVVDLSGISHCTSGIPAASRTKRFPTLLSTTKPLFSLRKFYLPFAMISALVCTHIGQRTQNAMRSSLFRRPFFGGIGLFLGHSSLIFNFDASFSRRRSG